MKVFVTGVSGQLGHDVMEELHKRGYIGIGSGRSSEYNGQIKDSCVKSMPYVQLDITDQETVRRTLNDIQPNVVIHCAAWTAVDLAEENEYKSAVWDINVKATRNIAETCNFLGCKMIYISTDYVFDGQGEEPWRPDETSYHPLNYYGQTKFEGEQAVANSMLKYFIVRISWVFGRNGNNFVKTMLNLGKRYPKLRVVCDQIGTPTYTRDLSRLLVDMIQTEKYGYYHVSNEGGYISWYDFASEIFRQAEIDIDVEPVTTVEYGLSKAARPYNSRLDKSKLMEQGFESLPTWKDALRRFMNEIEEKSWDR